MALSYLLAAGMDIEDQTLAPVAYLTLAEAQAVRHQAHTGFNAPLTSSVGRLFDAVAALIGLCEEISYEAQAAMMLESATDPQGGGFYEMPLENDVINPLPMIRAIVADLKAGVSAGSIAARFHNSLVRMSVEACRQIRQETELRTVAISGGVWQNMRLMNLILPALEAEGFTPLFHNQLTPNDGCVSLGQAAVALARLQG
jgi:hydrogenase maturation protein HypF